MKGIQDTSTRTYRDLLGNGSKYIIPKFQRDYSWDTEQWDDLWQDLLEVLNSSDSHYMGYLVLQTNDDKDFKIIDGQQRITTISILILSAIKCLNDLADANNDDDSNLARQEELLKRYIGVRDPVTLSSNNKLILNRNNDDYYKSYIASLRELKQRGIKATERLMKNCFEWFYPKIKKEYKTGEELALFIETVVDKLYFTVIKVGDELNAFRVFETLNARGVQLSSSDLLKNYLFSLVQTTSRIDDLEKQWSNLLVTLGKERLPEFLRFYWNSRNKNVRKNNLFKTIRKSIKNENDVFSLINELLKFADIFVALKNSNDELWSQYPNSKELKRYLYTLDIFKVQQTFSLLMTAYDALQIEEFEKLLRSIVVISFRYSIIGKLNPNELEKIYNNCAMNILEDKKFNEKLLLDAYVDDKKFKNDFINKSFKFTSRNKKILKYIFSEIEKQAGGNRIDLEDDSNTIEHILPQNPNDEWDWDDTLLERSINRLGNLTLLEKNLNKEIANNQYLEKLKVFNNSNFNITKSLNNEYPEEWTENTINSRQTKLANFAKTIWAI